MSRCTSGISGQLEKWCGWQSRCISGQKFVAVCLWASRSRWSVLGPDMFQPWGTPCVKPAATLRKAEQAPVDKCQSMFMNDGHNTVTDVAAQPSWCRNGLVLLSLHQITAHPIHINQIKARLGKIPGLQDASSCLVGIFVPKKLLSVHQNIEINQKCMGPSWPQLQGGILGALLSWVDVVKSW